MEAIEQQAMIGALQRLLAAPSVKGEPLPGQPFGPGVARALEEALALCGELGLKTRCFDGYAGDATYEVPGATETVGVLCHLDVVPAGEGWRYEPFAGTVEGKPCSFHLTTEQVPTFGMCTDISRFYTFVEGEFMEFYPDRQDVLRWDHLTEEMHRVCGGKWQNVPYRHCDSLH